MTDTKLDSDSTQVGSHKIKIIWQSAEDELTHSFTIILSRLWIVLVHRGRQNKANNSSLQLL